MNARSLLLMVIAASATAACSRAKDDRLFAPAACDYAAAFPIAPLIERVPEAAPGSVSTKAQTPKGYSPWLMAMCTAMPNGFDSVTPAALEAQDRANFEQLRAHHVTSSSTTDVRGSLTTSVGEIGTGAETRIFTQFTLVGPQSVLYVSTLEPAQGSGSVTKDFFAHIVRKPY